MATCLYDSRTDDLGFAITGPLTVATMLGNGAYEFVGPPAPPTPAPSGGIWEDILGTVKGVLSTGTELAKLGIPAYTEILKFKTQLKALQSAGKFTIPTTGQPSSAAPVVVPPSQPSVSSVPQVLMVPAGGPGMVPPNVGVSVKPPETTSEKLMKAAPWAIGGLAAFGLILVLLLKK